MNRNGLLSLFFILLSLPSLTGATPQAPENNQPLAIEASTFYYNHKQGFAEYSGHVIAIQGSRRLLADTLIVQRTPDGALQSLVAKGKPAYFTLQPDANRGRETEAQHEEVHGQALQITYRELAQQLILDGAAQLTQGQDRYQAPQIHYNLVDETVQSPTSNAGRTRIILQPKNYRHNS